MTFTPAPSPTRRGFVVPRVWDGTPHLRSLITRELEDVDEEVTNLKFRSELIAGLIHNEGDVVGRSIRAIDPSRRIIISQGFGVPIDWHGRGVVPLRSLAYIVPTLHLLRQLPESAIVEFYFATQGVLRANFLSVEGPSEWGEIPDEHPATYRAAMIAMEMHHCIRDYVSHFHPLAIPQVRILHDRIVFPNSPTERLIEELLKVAREVTSERVLRFVQRQAEKAVASGALEKCIPELRDLALRYMVEHLLYMRDQFPPPASIPPGSWSALLVPEMVTDYDHLIMIGGPAERIFYELRQSICQALGSLGSCDRNLQFFTPIGDPPTYHHQEGEPSIRCLSAVEAELPTVEQLLEIVCTGVGQAMGIRQAVLRDVLILLTDAAGGCDFRWCGRTATDLDKGRSPNLPWDILRRGWEALRRMYQRCIR